MKLEDIFNADVLYYYMAYNSEGELAIHGPIPGVIQNLEIFDNNLLADIVVNYGNGQLCQKVPFINPSSCGGMPDIDQHCWTWPAGKEYSLENLLVPEDRFSKILSLLAP